MIPSIEGVKIILVMRDFEFFVPQVHIENKQIALAASLCLEVGNVLRVCKKKRTDFH